VLSGGDQGNHVGNDGTLTISGAVSGTGSGLSEITATRAPKTLLSGPSTYTGPIVWSDATLVIDASWAPSATTITGTLLEGTGTVGALTVTGIGNGDAGIVSPGDPVGTLHTGNLSMAAGPGSDSFLGIEITGIGANLADQVQVTGTVNLAGGPILEVAAENFTPTPGQKFVIVDNDGTDAVQGTFRGLADGATLVSDTGNFFKISYKGGTGNDVELTALAPPAVSIVTGPGSGGGPNIRTFGGRNLSFDGTTGGTGGATVAAGNVLGGQLDNIVVGSGPGVPSQVAIFNPDGTFSGVRFSPYGSAFTGGVAVGVADVDGDGVDEIVTGAGPGGGPNVRVFSGDGTPLGSFFAYDPNFHGGVKVSGADINGDGIDEIVTGAGPGGGPNVEVFGANGSLKASFFAYDAGFHGGVNVAGADLDGDGFSEIVTGPGPGGGPHVRTFSGGGSPRGLGFFAYDPRFSGGVSVGAIPDFVRLQDDILVGAGPGGGPNVKGFLPDGTQTGSFFAYDGGFFGGVNVAGAALNLPQ
jgi:fibronectin-binding autotransporter adhesin